VSDGEKVRASLIEACRQEALPFRPRGFVNGSVRTAGHISDISRTVEKWYVQLSAEILDEALIGIGCIAAQTMVEMGGMEPQPLLGPERCEHMG
jgi:hypothetical protein